MQEHTITHPDDFIEGQEYVINLQSGEIKYGMFLEMLISKRTKTLHLRFVDSRGRCRSIEAKTFFKAKAKLPT